MTPEEINALAEKTVDSINLKLNSDQYNMLTRKIAAAVAEAVKAEWEAICAAMCQQFSAGLKAVAGDDKNWNGRFIHWLPDEQRYIGCSASKIRALGDEQKQEDQRGPGEVMQNFKVEIY